MPTCIKDDEKKYEKREIYYVKQLLLTSILLIISKKASSFLGQTKLSNNNAESNAMFIFTRPSKDKESGHHSGKSVYHHYKWAKDGAKEY